MRVNTPPTFNPISDPAPIVRNAGQQTVNLAGITDGGEGQTLTIAATSNNHTLLADPTITYTSPQPTGTLTYTPVANQVGSATITVTVGDGQNTIVRTFTVLVIASTQTYTVGTIADHPAGSPAPFAECVSATNTTCALRDALAYASSGTDTIAFKSGVAGTITLTNGPLTLTAGVTITGPGAAILAVDGNDTARVFIVSSGVNATISGLTVQRGNAGVSSGGGIVTDGSLTLVAVAVTHNSASTAAGIRINAGGILTLMSSAVTANSATGDAGGIGNAGTVIAANSTISGNTAGGSGSGGGINSTSTLTLINSTISANTANSGGGMNVVGGTTTLTNTIVAANTKGGVPNDIGGSVASGSSNNLTGTGGSGGLVDQATDPAHHNRVGVAAPGLDTLKNNGGPTQSVALLANSPAIAAGDHAVCAAVPVSNADQRGLPRPAAVCAIGAFEPQVTLTAISVPFRRGQRRHVDHPHRDGLRFRRDRSLRHDGGNQRHGHRHDDDHGDGARP